MVVLPASSPLPPRGVGSEGRIAMRHLIVGILVALTTLTLHASCFKGLDQRSVAGTVPIIVQGEIVKIDVAKGELHEHKTRRYADLAHIRIDKVYKNSLSDTKVEVKGEVTAWMHSVNQGMPGADKGDEKVAMSVSTDIAYKVGRKGIWFVFLAQDGKFYINRHPQQLHPIDKDADLEKAGIL